MVSRLQFISDLECLAVESEYSPRAPAGFDFLDDGLGHTGHGSSAAASGNQTPWVPLKHRLP